MFAGVDIHDALPHLAGMRAKHRVHLGHLRVHGRGIRTAVALLVYQVHHGMRNGRALLAGRADDEHRQRHGIGRQIEQLGDFLGILDDITDVAAPQAQGLSGDHGILRGNHGVLGRDGKVAQTRRAAGLLARTLDKLGLKAANMLKQIDPLGIIDHKYKCPGRLGDHGLVVAQVGQAVERSLLADAHDGVHHHGACRRRAARRVQDRRALFVGHRHGELVIIARKGTCGRTLLQDVQHRVARSFDRIAAGVHAHDTTAALNVRLANLLVHRLILANSLRSLYVSV